MKKYTVAFRDAETSKIRLKFNDVVRFEGAFDDRLFVEMENGKVCLAKPFDHEVIAIDEVK